MMTPTMPSALPVWKELKDHAAALRTSHLRHLFETEKTRFSSMSLSLPGLFADYSKNIVTAETLALLLRLAKDMKIELQRDDMFKGAPINNTENRAVLHTALRVSAKEKADCDSHYLEADVYPALEAMREFTSHVHSGSWRGFSGQEITDVVNIGIGGSSLGPQLVTEALAHLHHPKIKAHFVSNVEPSDISNVLKKCTPETTLFIVASKTFTTAETMLNARVARDFILRRFNNENAVSHHFVAVSTNVEAAARFGIPASNVFPFREWVGGRYSVWSSIGLSVMLSVGADAFMAFLAGARQMDIHFKSQPLEKNLPVLLALIGLWNRNFLEMPAYACIPYHSQLKRFPAYLQQLDMESNGKSVDKQGIPVSIKTGPAIFGEPGTDAQHSFFQWLHQSTDVTPVDFIGVVKNSSGTKSQLKKTHANMLAQAEALMIGRDNTAEPHRHFSGNRPSTTLLLEELSPKTLGMLMALYEHKVFVQGCLWNINSFDQWGVELGKTLADKIEQEMETHQLGQHDSSTAGLLQYISDTLMNAPTTEASQHPEKRQRF